MRLLLHWGAVADLRVCLVAISLGVGGELEEQLLQPGSVGAAQLDQRDAGRVGEVSDRLGRRRPGTSGRAVAGRLGGAGALT